MSGILRSRFPTFRGKVSQSNSELTTVAGLSSRFALGILPVFSETGITGRSPRPRDVCLSFGPLVSMVSALTTGQSPWFFIYLIF